MSNEIIKVLDYLGEKVGITIDWTNSNVIPHIEELSGKFIKWEISTSVAWMLIWWIVTIIVLICAIINHKKGWDDTGYWIVLACVLLVTLIVTIVQVFDIIECATFPEKAIYDYIKNIL